MRRAVGWGDALGRGLGWQAGAAKLLCGSIRACTEAAVVSVAASVVAMVHLISSGKAG